MSENNPLRTGGNIELTPSHSKDTGDESLKDGDASLYTCFDCDQLILHSPTDACHTAKAATVASPVTNEKMVLKENDDGDDELSDGEISQIIEKHGLTRSPKGTKNMEIARQQLEAQVADEEEMLLSSVYEHQFDDLLLWLARTQVDQVHPRPLTGTFNAWKFGEVLCVKAEERCAKVFSKLIVEGFSSAPILDYHCQYMGFIDLLDLVYHTLNAFQEEHDSKKKKKKKEKSQEEDKLTQPSNQENNDHDNDDGGGDDDDDDEKASQHQQQLGQDRQAKKEKESVKKNNEEKQEKDKNDGEDDNNEDEDDEKYHESDSIPTEFDQQKFVQTRVIDIVSDPWFVRDRGESRVVYRGTSLLSAIETMVRTGQERIPIVDYKSKPVSILTFSMIISLFSQHSHRLGSLNSTTIHSLVPHLSHCVPTIHTSIRALDAFAFMIDRRYTGLAVIDDSGKLVDTLSVRDIRSIGLKGEHVDRLFLSISEYKEAARAQFPSQTPVEPLTVSQDDTFETVFQRFYDGNIHRLFVVDSTNGKPLYMITQRSLLRYILSMIGLSSHIKEEYQYDKAVKLHEKQLKDNQLKLDMISQESASTSAASTITSTSPRASDTSNIDKKKKQMRSILSRRAVPGSQSSSSSSHQGQGELKEVENNSSTSSSTFSTPSSSYSMDEAPFLPITPPLLLEVDTQHHNVSEASAVKIDDDTSKKVELQKEMKELPVTPPLVLEMRRKQTEIMDVHGDKAQDQHDIYQELDENELNLLREVSENMGLRQHKFLTESSGSSINVPEINASPIPFHQVPESA